MTESEWAVWCLSCASTWLGASPYGALPLAVPVKARLQRREILQARAQLELEEAVETAEEAAADAEAASGDKEAGAVAAAAEAAAAVEAAKESAAGANDLLAMLAE